MEKRRIVFHVDMDAFFSSVEQRDNPDLKGKPVIVGAKPGQRGVVSAASYEARGFGIHSAMPVSEAFRRCPQGVFISPRMDAYTRASKEVMAILSEFSPGIEQISVDEAFIDMSGSDRLFGPPYEAAKKISTEIKTSLKLTASIGIAPNKFLAKIASDINKPDNITQTPFDPEKIIEWLSPMPVGKIWGVGQKTREILHRNCVYKIGDLQGKSADVLEKKFGKYGASLYYLCRGIDERPVEMSGGAKSISREHTFHTDSSDREEWKKVLLTLSVDIARKARRNGMKGSTVVLSYRHSDFSRHSKRLPLPYPCDISKTIYEYGVKLLSRIEATSLRLIGIGICDFQREQQLDLFRQPEQIDTLQNAERAVDKIIQKFGEGSVSKGTQMESRD
ncbi:DNA polymerase IV [Chitinispirillum alkaliphilum]|nr:DNA polymerase IV [Chitinispirillum alkaliphilum]